MKYLLDTNTCVHYLRYKNASPVAAKLASENPGDVVLCSVVVGELWYGAVRSRDVAKNLAELNAFRAGFVSLPFDDRSAEEFRPRILGQDSGLAHAVIFVDRECAAFDCRSHT